MKLCFLTFSITLLVLFGNHTYGVNSESAQEIKENIIEKVSELQSNSDTENMDETNSLLKDTIALRKVYPGYPVKEYMPAIRLLSQKMEIFDSMSESILAKEQFTMDDFKFIAKYAEMNWLIAARNLSNEFGHFFSSYKDSIKKSRNIHQIIVDKTSNVSMLPSLTSELAFFSLDSRLWLVIFELIEGNADAIDRLDDFKRFTDDTLTQIGKADDQITRILWMSKLVECEMHLALKNYQKCIEAYDSYFLDIYRNIDINHNDETIDKIIAAEAMDSKIRSLIALNQLDEALTLAESHAKLGNHYKLPEARQDGFVERWELVLACHRSMDKKNGTTNTLELIEYLVDNYPIQFSHYAEQIILYKRIKLQKTELQKN